MSVPTLLRLCFCISGLESNQLIGLGPPGRVLRRYTGDQDREVEQELHQALLRRLHLVLLRLRQRL